MSNLRRAGQEATARDQTAKHSPESLQADEELQKTSFRDRTTLFT